MKAWQKVFREGIVPNVEPGGLLSLYEALANDDPRLIQGATTTPPPLQCVSDWPCECACPIGWTTFRGNPEVTVGDVEEDFAMVCFEADQILGLPAACREFINWWDDGNYEQVRRELKAELKLILGVSHVGAVKEAG